MITNNYEQKIIDCYHEIINSFYILYPQKKNIYDIDKNKILDLCTTFINKINKSSNVKCVYYKNLLLNKKCKLFKALKLSLIPKIKMELVLLADNDEKLVEINNIWKNIKQIVINYEYLTGSPNEDYIKLLELDTDDTLTYEDKKKDTLLNDKLLEKFGLDKNAILNSKSNNIFKDIINDIKESELYKNSDKKLTLSEILESTKDIQAKYTDKLNSGELSVNDLIGNLLTLMNNQDEYNKLIDELNLNNRLNSESLLQELTSLLPDEYKSITKLLQSKNSFNPLDLLGGLMGNNITDLTDEQLNELDDFYSKLSI